MEKVIAIIDLKAFYASFECVERGLDPFFTPLVVCDTERGMGTIVLSCSPYAKKLGIPSRCRRRDIKHIPNLIYAKPQMEKYVMKSCEIVGIISNYIAEEDIHVYSIDECFINLTPYLMLYDLNPQKIVQNIQNDIFKETGIVATAGISYNTFLAKICLDIEGKNNAPSYQATWSKEDIKNKLWKIKPLSKLWGISTGYEKKLNNLGIFSVGDLANSNKNLLIENIGVMGEQLHDLANGIDDSDLREKYIPKSNSFSTGQALIRDYTYKEIPTIIQEMVDLLCKRLHKNNLTTSSVSLIIIYSKACQEGGFSHQVKLTHPSDNNEDILNYILDIYKRFIKDEPIRNVYISFNTLKVRKHLQLDLFEDVIEKEKDRSAMVTIENIQDKYGKTKIARGSVLLDSSTYLERAKQIGGHRK